MDDFGYHRPITRNVCPPIWSTKSLCGSRKKIRLRLVFSTLQSVGIWDETLLPVLMCYFSVLRYREKKNNNPFRGWHLTSGCLHFRWKKRPSRVWYTLITFDWKSHESLVFNVNFMVFLYHIKHSGSFLIYYLPLWVLAIHECFSSVAKFINSLRVISNGSF